MASSTPTTADPSRPAAAGAAEPFLSILYCCRTSAPLGRDALHDLAAKAQARNRALGVTGMLVYDDGHVVQWLEGPADAVRTVWRSIRSDPRQVGIEVLGECVSPVRMFEGWDMRVVSRDGDAARDAAQAERDALVTELAGRALAGAGEAIDVLLDARLTAGQDLPSLCRDLIEPAVRRIGTWWGEDRARDCEVTLALAQLQRSARRLGAACPAASDAAGDPARDVLIVTDQAEPHALGATLVGDVLRAAGWFVAVEFSHSDPDIVAAARASSCDVLVLLLGDVLAHPERIEAVAADIAAARRASTNPDLVVLVGGRMVLDAPDTIAAMVGADAAFATAADVLDKARDLLRGRPAPTRRAAPRPAVARGLPRLPPGWFWVP